MPENAGKNLRPPEGSFLTREGKRKLVFDNEVAYQIEQRYGSLQKYIEVMSAGAYMGTLGALFSMAWGIDEKEGRALVVGSELKAYFETITRLIGEFLGADLKMVPVGEAPAQGMKDGPSPGNGSTASPSSAATSLRRGSGA